LGFFACTVDHQSSINQQSSMPFKASRPQDLVAQKWKLYEEIEAIRDTHSVAGVRMAVEPAVELHPDIDRKARWYTINKDGLKLFRKYRVRVHCVYSLSDFRMNNT
jgi:hypothetical protein